MSERSSHAVENVEISAVIAKEEYDGDRRGLLIYQEFPDISDIYAALQQKAPDTGASS